MSCCSNLSALFHQIFKANSHIVRQTGRPVVSTPTRIIHEPVKILGKTRIAVVATIWPIDLYALIAPKWTDAPKRAEKWPGPIVFAGLGLAQE
jgi:hypothetical protein